MSVKSVKVKIDSSNLLIAFMFISYFCSMALWSAYYKIIGDSFIAVYNFLFFGCILLVAISEKRKRLVIPFMWYALVVFLFTYTILDHPEYKDWYFDKTYGIQTQFFRAVGGIWAFLVVYLVPEKEKMLKYLQISSGIMFLYLCLKYISAQRIGYWATDGGDASIIIENEYDFGFGYNMLFPTLLFLAEGFLNRKRKYYILAVIGIIMIIGVGSRWAFVCVVADFLFMIPYKWKAMSRTKKIVLIMSIMIFLPAFFVIYAHVGDIIIYLQTKGFSSRTLSSLLAGDFSDANGRDKIYRMTIERIREGGMFGNGVLGERIIVGQYYRWGYAHNIFLELYAAFGYLGGTVVSFALLFNIIRTAVNCHEKTEQVIFVTFLGTSMKLLASDSFWFNSSFWGLLAIIVMWRKTIPFQRHDYDYNNYDYNSYIRRI